MFKYLTAPVEVLADENRWVTGIRCVQMELGEPDASGRRRPIKIPGSEFIIDCDLVVVAIGTKANPLLTGSAPELTVNEWGYLLTDEYGMTSLPGVFAGGDIVRGAATVILAMGDGKKSAKAIDAWLRGDWPPSRRAPTRHPRRRPRPPADHILRVTARTGRTRLAGGRPRRPPLRSGGPGAAYDRADDGSPRPARSPRLAAAGRARSIRSCSRPTRCCSCGRRTSARPTSPTSCSRSSSRPASAALLTVLLGLVLRDVRRAALIVTPVVIGLLVYGHAARVGRVLDIPVLLQRVGWVALVVVAAVAALRLSGPLLQRVGTALTRVAAILIVITLVLIVPFQLSGIPAGGAAADDSALATTTTAPKRDVYWFIFDRYGSDRALDLLYGIQNDLTPWLREQGFTVLDNAHPNYARTDPVDRRRRPR